MSATEATTAPAVEKVETAPVETKTEETKATVSSLYLLGQPPKRPRDFESS